MCDWVSVCVRSASVFPSLIAVVSMKASCGWEKLACLSVYVKGEGFQASKQSWQSFQFIKALC